MLDEEMDENVTTIKVIGVGGGGGNAGHPCNGDRGQNRITESRDGKDHAECDEDHGFFTNGLHGTKHTGI